MDATATIPIDVPGRPAGVVRRLRNRVCVRVWPGAHARNSIGLVLVAGMAVGTAFTLFFVPAIYMLIAKEHRAVEAGADAAPAPEPVTS